MPKLLIMPPLRDKTAAWARRIADALSSYAVVLAADEDEARHQIVDADAVFGWVSPDLLPLAERLRWMQSPAAGPKAGYYYPALVTHPVVVCNLRGIYNDHIGQHVMMYVLALARALTDYLAAQRAARWDPAARRNPYLDLNGATVLIVGVGGIGHETARLCNAFGMRVLGTDARWEYATPDVERHAPAALDDVLPQADFVIVTVPHTPETEGMSVVHDSHRSNDFSRHCSLEWPKPSLPIVNY